MSDPRLLRSLEKALGEIVLGALREPDILEIMLNPCGSLWLERFGEPMRHVGTLSPEQGRQVVSLVASALGTTITRETPVVEGELPLDGSRFEGTDCPIAPGVMGRVNGARDGRANGASRFVASRLGLSLVV